MSISLSIIKDLAADFDGENVSRLIRQLISPTGLIAGKAKSI